MTSRRVRTAALTPLLPLLQWKDLRWLRVRRRQLPHRRGARLLLLSDLHARDDWMPRESVRRIVQRVNEVEDVHAVLLLGDFVGDDIEAIDWAAEELAAIRAPMWGVLGNHDHWTDPQRVAHTLERAGVRMLVNRAEPLPATPLWLAGIDSCWGGNPQANAALKAAPDAANTVVLGHEPHLATMHESYLHVAGHSHHGQVRSPLLTEFVARRNYVRFSEPFPRGLYRRGDDSWVYTTAGVGFSTVCFRFNCAPELVVLDV